jgi:hypothetical protein
MGRLIAVKPYIWGHHNEMAGVGSLYNRELANHTTVLEPLTHLKYRVKRASTSKD